MVISAAILASGGSPVDLDATVVVQLGFFLLFFLLLRSVLFRPAARLIKARHAATEGTMEEALELEKETNQLTEKIDAQIADIRSSSSAERERVVEKARRAEKELLAKTRDEAQQIMEKARQSTKAEAEEIRRQLSQDTEKLAVEVASTVLSRSL